MDPRFPNRIRALNAWFHSHDNGEFSVSPVGCESIRDGEPQTAKTIIYTTKRPCLPRIQGLAAFPAPVASLARYGLPSVSDLGFLAGSAEPKSRLFVGDADPPDILVFAWLREHVPITWYGVGDAMLVRHGNIDNASILLGLSPAELAAVPRLAEFCPDYRQLLGDYCASLLDQGLKIELEGAISNRA